MMTDRLSEIRKRLEAATPGPWMWWTSCSWRRLGTEDQSTTIMEPITQQCDNHPDLYFRNGGYRGPDATFIANAPTDIAYLLRVIEEYEAEMRDSYWSENVIARARKRALEEE